MSQALRPLSPLFPWAKTQHHAKRRSARDICSLVFVYSRHLFEIDFYERKNVITSQDVEDSNDNFPIFDRDSYSFSILENSIINTYIGEVTAVDADSDSFGTVTYSLSNTEEFYIDELGKLYTKSTIDRETRPSYQLRVTASDGGEGNVLVVPES